MLNRLRASILVHALLMIFTASIAAQPGGPVGDKGADHAALHQLRLTYERAVRDADPALLKPDLDSKFTAVMVTGDQVDTFASFQAYWERIQHLMGEGGQYHTTIHVAEPITIMDDMATAHGTTDDLVVTGDGEKYRFTSRWTAVCRKQGGKWKILRLHASMDALNNPFVQARVKGTAYLTGALAGLVGLIVGWLAHLVFTSLRRRRRGRALAADPSSITSSE